MKKIIEIHGMHCKSCSMLIKSELEDQKVKAIINDESGKAEIEFDEKKISLQQIKEIIKKLGYQV